MARTTDTSKTVAIDTVEDEGVIAVVADPEAPTGASVEFMRVVVGFGKHRVGSVIPVAPGSPDARLCGPLAVSPSATQLGSALEALAALSAGDTQPAK